MESTLADLIMLAHAGYIAFVLFGLIVIVLGLWRGWRWVRNFWFRAAHLAAIAYVALQALAGVDCPLTVWESDLRWRAGERGYQQGFIADFVHRLIFYQAPVWAFTLGYVLFAVAVAATFVLGPPNRPVWMRTKIEVRAE